MRSRHAARMVVMVAVAGVIALTALPLRSQSHDLPTVPLELTEAERAWLDAHRNSIRLARCPAFPPVDFVEDDGHAAGISHDFIHLIEQRLNVRFQTVQLSSFPELIPALKRREADVVTSISMTAEREGFLTFFPSHTTVAKVIIVNTSLAGSYSLDSMAGMKVAAVAGYANTEEIRQRYPDVNFVLVANEQAGLEQVSFGEIDAMVVDLGAASYHIRRSKITNLRVGGETGYSYDLRIACRKDWPLLASSMTKALGSVTPAERQAIHDRWIKLDSEPEGISTKVWYIVAGAIAGCATVVLLISLWNRTLKRKVLVRTRELRASDERYRVLLATIPYGVQEIDCLGRITFANELHHRIYGWRPGTLVGTEIVEFYVPDERDSLRAYLAYLVESQPDPTPYWGQNLRLDGTLFNVQVDWDYKRDAAGEVVGFISVLTDVTDRKRDEAERARLEQELQHSRKMEAIGQLAGGVAHDFNNLLTVIQGNAEMLAESLPPGEGRDQVHEIVRASHRASDLTKQLLAFARKGGFQRVAVDIHQTIPEMIRLLSRTIDKRIETRLELEADATTVMGDPGQIENALLNLGLNARDAMPDGGVLILATRNIPGEPGHDGGGGSPSSWLEIRVTDTGEGIAPEVQERIFEPFYTTKEVGAGTGLGLAAVYGCISGLGGSIEVDSEQGRGATFRILLPAERCARTEQAAEGAPASLVRGTGTILIVDDEEMVRNFAATAVAHLGYDVKVCADGAEAVDVFRQQHAEIDLVLLDLIMPRLDGVDTFHRMRQIDPDARILLSSGFSRDGRIDELVAKGALGLLAKPFRIDELSEALARHLAVDGTGTSPR